MLKQNFKIEWVSMTSARIGWIDIFHISSLVLMRIIIFIDLNNQPANVCENWAISLSLSTHTRLGLIFLCKFVELLLDTMYINDLSAQFITFPFRITLCCDKETFCTSQQAGIKGSPQYDAPHYNAYLNDFKGKAPGKNERVLYTSRTYIPGGKRAQECC